MTVWISHRGVKERHTENSMEAFRAAKAGGFKWLETDLRCTRDGVVVLSHDPDLGRTAGHGVNLAKADWQNIQGIRLKGGEQLATFEGFAREFMGMHWVLDIKPETGRRVVEALRLWAEKSRDHREQVNRNCRFLFWDGGQERLCREYFPQADFFPREAACYRAALAVKVLGGFGGGIRAGASYALVPKFAGLAFFLKGVVEAYHRKGAKVLAFLPGERAEVQAALDAGVDEILTDRGIEADGV